MKFLSFGYDGFHNAAHIERIGDIYQNNERGGAHTFDIYFPDYVVKIQPRCGDKEASEKETKDYAVAVYESIFDFLLSTDPKRGRFPLHKYYDFYYEKERRRIG